MTRWPSNMYYIQQPLHMVGIFPSEIIVCAARTEHKTLQEKGEEKKKNRVLMKDQNPLMCATLDAFLYSGCAASA